MCIYNGKSREINSINYRAYTVAFPHKVFSIAIFKCIGDHKKHFELTCMKFLLRHASAWNIEINMDLFGSCEAHLAAHLGVEID